MLLVDWGQEDLKADGNNIVDMSCMGIAQPHQVHKEMLWSSKFQNSQGRPLHHWERYTYNTENILY